eukprot:COSAG05_NODE_643_length_8130_cov_11.217781_7_plen_135_part_00
MHDGCALDFYDKRKDWVLPYACIRIVGPWCLSSAFTLEQVLGKLLNVAVVENDTAAVNKAYKKALIEHHPDRARARGLSTAAAVAAEETYKLLQTLHAKWEQKQEKRQQQQQQQQQQQPQPPRGGRNKRSSGRR